MKVFADFPGICFMPKLVLITFHWKQIKFKLFKFFFILISFPHGQNVSKHNLTEHFIALVELQNLQMEEAQKSQQELKKWQLFGRESRLEARSRTSFCVELRRRDKLFTKMLAVISQQLVLSFAQLSSPPSAKEHSRFPNKRMSLQCTSVGMC